MLFILSISILSCKQCRPYTLIYPQVSKMLYPKVFLVFFDMWDWHIDLLRDKSLDLFHSDTARKGEAESA